MSRQKREQGGNGNPKTGLHARVTVLFRWLRIKVADQDTRTAGTVLLSTKEFYRENRATYLGRRE